MDKDKKSLFQLKNLPKKTFEITATVLWSDIEKQENKVLEEQKKNFEVKGFRKGMAPLNLIKESLGQEKLIRLVLENILSDLFQKAITELKLKPIVSPKVELLSANEKEDWQVKFTSCEEPEINLGSYKDEIKKNAKVPAKIWTPDSKQEEKDKPPENTKENKINAALTWLIQNIKIEISDLLLEDEVNRKLSGLLEQTQKLGLSVEQYLTSIGKTIDQIKSEFEKQSSEALIFEFILGKIAEQENISVSEEELTKAVANAKTEEEKKALESQKYYLAVLLRRQKTLDFLANLL